MQMFSEKDFKMLRRAIGQGITDALVAVAFAFLLGTFVMYVWAFLFVDYDDTDDAANGERSGVALVTDYGTGCQYLQSTQGHLTPRLNSDGKQICKN